VLELATHAGAAMSRSPDGRSGHALLDTREKMAAPPPSRPCEPHGLPAAGSNGGAAKGREEAKDGSGGVPPACVAHARATRGKERGNCLIPVFQIGEAGFS
jgi:hypothetical protein